MAGSVMEMVSLGGVEKKSWKRMFGRFAPREFPVRWHRV
jgi:hypothetical protein